MSGKMSSQQPQPDDWHESPPMLARQISPSILANIKIPTRLYQQPSSNPYNFLSYSHEEPTFYSLFQTQLAPSSMITSHKLYPHFRTLSLDDQLKSFVSAQLLTIQQLQLRWQLAFDLLYNLRIYYPQCEVYVFGSLLTGLGDVNSDVDLYVDLFADDGAFLEGHSARSQTEKKISDELKAILNYSKCPHTGHRFVDSVRCLGARIPVIRFRHMISFIKCDLSFGNRLAVQNSKLLLFYLNYDRRIGPFLVFLRYWAKFHGISGELKIKQYALSLLALVYLIKKEIIPSIHLLQTLAAEERSGNGMTKNPDQFEGWDSSFCENREIIDHHFKPTSTSHPEDGDNSGLGRNFLKMLLDFFEMFAFLDLSSVLICTLSGEILEKSLISYGDKGELPKALKVYLCQMFHCNGPLCIQDPFVLSFNVGAVAKADVVRQFQRACKVTYEKLSLGGGDEVHSIMDLFIRLSNEGGEVNNK